MDIIFLYLVVYKYLYAKTVEQIDSQRLYACLLAITNEVTVQRSNDHDKLTQESHRIAQEWIASGAVRSFRASGHVSGHTVLTAALVTSAQVSHIKQKKLTNGLLHILQSPFFYN